MKKEEQIRQIYSDIKKVKIQGASNIAKAAIKAYMLKHTLSNKKKLLSLRPTEPTLSNALNFFDKLGEKRTLSHFSNAQQKINISVLKLIKNRMIIYTHCHSTNTIKALIYAKKR